ncbi:MAG: hypothetical protein ACNA77_09495 [Opitutales bacterium]
MNLYHTTDAEGISLLNPDADAMRAVLDQLDAPDAEDAEHPDVSLIHDASAWSLSVFPNGTIIFENLEDDDEAPRHLTQISRHDALQMWQKLAHGEIENLLELPWKRD